MLNRIHVKGYKSLADVEVSLQPLSVLFGPNAAGKSNFLDALQLLSRTEGIIPALEPAHALAYLARAARSGEIPQGSTVLVTLSGRGDKDAQQVMDLLHP